MKVESQIRKQKSAESRARSSGLALCHGLMLYMVLTSLQFHTETELSQKLLLLMINQGKR